MNVWNVKWRGERVPLLDRIFKAWEGTPYMEGQQYPQAGVDCFRFVCAVLDTLEGRRTPLEHIPADQAMHAPQTAVAAVRAVLRLYEPYEIVTDGLVAPGDVFITGQIGAGPGHAMIAGNDQGELWHCPGPRKRVCRTGTGIHGELHRIYRIKNKESRWPSS